MVLCIATQAVTPQKMSVLLPQKDSRLLGSQATRLSDILGRVVSSVVS
jgi:hypothetical protein